KVALEAPAFFVPPSLIFICFNLPIICEPCKHPNAYPIIIIINNKFTSSTSLYTKDVTIYFMRRRSILLMNSYFPYPSFLHLRLTYLLEDQSYAYSHILVESSLRLVLI